MGPVELSSEDPKVAEQLQRVFDSDDVSFRQAHLLAGDGVAVELFEFKRPVATRGRGAFKYWEVGIFHICLLTDAIDQTAARIVAAGGTQRTQVSEIFPGERFRFCYCEDPFGNILELATHPHAEAFGGRHSY